MSSRKSQPPRQKAAGARPPGRGTATDPNRPPATDRQGPAPLMREIGAAAEYLRQCRHELAALGANELAKDRIPSASRELDDILEDGGEFSNRVMTAAERIMNAPMDDPEAYRALVREAVTTIIVQCAFHDITAQRARRIRGVLDGIERRLARIATFVATRDMPDIVDFTAPEMATDKPSAGPAPRGQGNAQDVIDRILAAPQVD